MSWSRDPSIIWPWHMTNHIIYSHDHDIWPTNFIKSSSIPTSASPFILTSTHHQFQHPRHHSSWHQLIIDFNIHITILAYDYVLVSFITATHVFSKSRNLTWAWNKVLRGLSGRLPSVQRPIQIQVVVALEKYLRSLLIKATDRSHSEWWAKRLARLSISTTLEDVNISFNHPPNYLIGKIDGRVISQSGSLGNEI